MYNPYEGNDGSSIGNSDQWFLHREIQEWIQELNSEFGARERSILGDNIATAFSSEEKLENIWIMCASVVSKERVNEVLADAVGQQVRHSLNAYCYLNAEFNWEYCEKTDLTQNQPSIIQLYAIRRRSSCKYVLFINMSEVIVGGEEVSIIIFASRARCKSESK